MMDQNFRSLRAYQESKELVKQVYELLKKFPKEEQYALCDQLRRSVISVPSNIAEGMGRYSTKEQVHFLEIAFGSLMEVSAQMDVACDLAYVTNEDLKSIDARVEAVAALLSGLRNKRISQGVNL
jgi:four helix bundle protein